MALARQRALHDVETVLAAVMLARDVGEILVTAWGRGPPSTPDRPREPETRPRTPLAGNVVAVRTESDEVWSLAPGW